MGELSIWKRADIVVMLRWARVELRRNEEEHDAVVTMLRALERRLRLVQQSHTA